MPFIASLLINFIEAIVVVVPGCRIQPCPIQIKRVPLFISHFNEIEYFDINFRGLSAYGQYT